MVPNEVIERQYQLYRKSRAPRDLAPVLEALAPKLIATAIRAGLDENGAEDTMQETFLGLLRAEEQLDSERPIVPYVNGIAERQIKAEIRRRAKLRQVHEQGVSEPVADKRQESLKLERDELEAKLRKAIARLSGANGPVVSAALLEGMSVEEIAEKLNINHSAAAVRLHRGLQRLRESLGSRASLSLLVMTIPRHRIVLPGILSSAGLTLFGVGPGILVPVALLLFAGIWGLVSLFQGEGEVDSLVRTHGVPPDLTVAVADAPASDETENTAAREAIPVDDLEPAVAPAENVTVIVSGSLEGGGGTTIPASADIYLLATTPSIALPTVPLEPVTTSNAQGLFELDSSMFGSDPTPTVLVRAPGIVGYVDLTEEHRASGELPAIQMRKEMPITIETKDSSGAPLEGIELSAVASSERFVAPSGPTAIKFGYFFIDPYHHLYGAVTNENGRAEIHGIPGYGARGFVVFLSLKGPGFGREALNFKLDQATGINETIVMRRTDEMSLGGLIHDTENQPIVGAEVRFLARGETPVTGEVLVRSDESGAWSLPHEVLDDFPIFLVVERDGFCSARLSYGGPGELDGNPVDVLLRRSAPLEGLVVDEQGRGVPSATVDITTQHTSQRFESNERGEFTATGLTADPRRIRVSGVVGEGSARSLAVDVGADATSVKLVLKGASEATELVIRQAEGAAWERVKLIPIEAGSEAQSYAASKIEGNEAHFQGIRSGRWLVAGITAESVACVQSIEILGQQAVSTHEVSQDNHASLKLWLDQKKDHPVAVGGKPGLLVARHVELAWLPDWLEHTQVRPRSMFRSEFHPESERIIERLVPGVWDLFAFAPGWAIGPLRFELEAGAQAAPVLDYTPAGLVTFNVGHFHRGNLLQIDVRRSADEPWAAVAQFAQGTHDSFAHELWLPGGTWSWRANVHARTEVGERFQMMPSMTGTVEVDLTTPAAISLWNE